MQGAKLLVSGLFLTAALAVSGPLVAGAAAQEANYQVRIYDSHHHDYHNWDNREDRAYRNYQQERHDSYVAYEHRKHRYQQHYWNWRHSHPDRD
jgi:hypothetical protein